jgi:uncharacterized protein YyaL (SSP411 family)
MLIEWLEWSTEAFGRAERAAMPVLLSIAAPWCRACHEMDRTTYADPEVAAIVRERFVPVRVDADRRPDINERYNLGGWPTTGFLTARGDLITGGTFVAADRMPAVLRRVAGEYAARPATGAIDYADHAAGGTAAAVAASESDRATIAAIFASFDEEHGGFGVEPKFPHAAPLQLAMALFRETSDPRWQHIVVRTLDAMADGALWDAARGGFRRYASTRDWKLPHDERLLDVNASLLRVYAEAVVLFGRAPDRDRCTRIAAFITQTLGAEAGGYHGSDADRVLYADANANATGALLAAAVALGSRELARDALASFERVTLVCYKPGAGLAHYFDGAARVRGLLNDQVAAIAALLDAHAVTEGEPYRMMAEELGLFIVRELQDPGGGFLDRAPAPRTRWRGCRTSRCAPASPIQPTSARLPMARCAPPPRSSTARACSPRTMRWPSGN